ncbi:Uncharacterised protein [Mycobacterium tuberculosis]|uniref:Uncharacterized protein n=1 Tax=Mycobacterium tuberculosis TaxID=1773 RepID=A0A654TUQ6_MYCTX|nr:Uncharacterised protein [Mycobacterium tuberculosis]COY03916.1 Uncharacterised protein [Mycobacterium tuberculosis]
MAAPTPPAAAATTPAPVSAVNTPMLKTMAPEANWAVRSIQSLVLQWVRAYSISATCACRSAT